MKDVAWADYLRQYDTMISINPSYEAVRTSVLSHVERAQLRDGAWVVDVGCGTGQVLLPLARRYPRARFLGVDADEGCLALVREKAEAEGLRNVELQNADARRWQAPGPVAVCVFTHSLYTLGALHDPQGPRKALEHARSCLEPGGRLVLTDIQRRLDYKRWALYLFLSSGRRFGLRKTLATFAANASARRANIAIEKSQRRGDMILASLPECRRLVESAGFSEILHASEDLYAPGPLGRPIDNQVVARA